MLNGFPLPLAEERGQRDGEIGKHKQREREGIEHAARAARVDVAALGDGGDRADHEEREVHAQQHLSEGLQRDEDAPARPDAPDGERQIARDAHRRENERRHDGHRHVKAREVPAQDAAEQACAVALENLQIPLRPAQALPPRLAEGGGLLIVEHGVGAEGDFAPLQDLVDGELNVLGQQVERPRAGLLEHGAAEEKPRAGDGTARPEEGARVV